MRQVFFFALAASVAAVIGLAPTYHVSLAILAGIDALAATGLIMLIQAGQVSLGHAAYVGLGAYASAILTRDYGLTPWLGLPAGAAVAASAALPLGFVALKLRGTYLPLATLAWGMAVYVILVAATPVTGGPSGFDNVPPLSFLGRDLGAGRVCATLVWLSVLLATVSLARLLRSRQGRALRAIRHHEALAVAFGINPARVKIVAFVLSAALAGFAGALYAHQAQFVSPAPFGLGASFTLLIIVMLGGVGHPAGAVLGAITVALMNLTLQTVFSGFISRIGPVEPVAFGLLLVVLLLKWPGGIWSALEPHLPPPSTRQHGVRQSVRPNALRGRPATDARKAEPILELLHVDKRFGGLQALCDVSFRVLPRGILGLIGPNGAGKSTAFNIMSGLSRPTSGEVLIDGHCLNGKPWQVIGQGLARTFQHVKLVEGMSVLENVALGAFWRGNAGWIDCLTGLDRAEEAATLQAAAAALERVGLTAQADSLCSSLPLGRQRLVEIARAIAAAPAVLLLDEPAAGLRAGEKAALAALLQRLRGEGMTIVLVEHDMELVMRSVDRLVVLNTGRVLADGPALKVRSDPRVIDAYIGAGVA
jgi:branched-chain amino acid transport system permease protein